MNKKGFTTIELLLTMLVVVTIMVSITSVTYTYRDRSKYEETVTEVTNYKNMVTKIIYDDILDTTNKAIKIEKNTDKIYTIVKTDTTKNVTLEIIDRDVTKDSKQIHEVGIKYDNIEYIIPGSENSYITFEGTTLYPNDFPEREDTGLYSLDIVFSHRNLEDNFKIHFAIDTYIQ